MVYKMSALTPSSPLYALQRRPRVVSAGPQPGLRRPWHLTWVYAGPARPDPYITHIPCPPQATAKGASSASSSSTQAQGAQQDKYELIRQRCHGCRRPPLASGWVLRTSWFRERRTPHPFATPADSAPVDATEVLSTFLSLWLMWLQGRWYILHRPW